MNFPSVQRIFFISILIFSFIAKFHPSCRKLNRQDEDSSASSVHWSVGLCIR